MPTDRSLALAQAEAMLLVARLSMIEREELAVHMVTLLDARDGLENGYWHDSLSVITDLAPTFAATLDRAIRRSRAILERIRT